MDDRLIAQVKATAQALRDTVTQTERELADAEAERAAIEARIGQLEELREQLITAAEQADQTVSVGTRPGGTTAGAAKKTASKRASTKKAATKRATGRKSSASPAAPRKATPAAPRKATPIAPPER